MILALGLLTAALLLIFWRGTTGPSEPADHAPNKPPEVVLSPLPENETPPPPAAVGKPTPSLQTTPGPIPGREPGGRSGDAERTASPGLAGNPGTVPQPQPIKPQYRKARLFFASIDASGKIAMKSVIRPVPIGDSPLLDTLGSLLAGPTPQEINLGMLSMIPTGSRLLSAVMKKDMIVLDFNEMFRYNKLGVEGQMAQLRQIVYSATEFSNVKKVQILIEGKKVEFLGTEGVSIGKPLDRESLGD
jgi:germination protein M